MLQASFKPQIKQSIFLLVLLLMVQNATSLEQPDYTVLYEQEGVEFRQYSPYLITETVVDSNEDYQDAASVGFKRLFSYISGNNSAKADIAMTAPVQHTRRSESIESSERIAMTAPVQQIKDEGVYRVSFVLPRKYTVQTAPVPLDSRVRTVQLPAKTMAVVRYSGRWTLSNFKRYENKLLTSLQANGVSTHGSVQSAFYNAPYVLPIFRRNEVMIEVRDVSQSGVDLSAKF